MSALRRRHSLAIALIAPLLSAMAGAAEPRYAAEVPVSVTTPDTVRTTLLGDLTFFDGTPSAETVRKTYDFLDVSRGAEAFLNGIPAASVYALLEGVRKAGVEPGGLGLFEELADARTLLLTANSTTMYGMVEIDVKNGPVVVQVPPASSARSTMRTSAGSSTSG